MNANTPSLSDQQALELLALCDLYLTAEAVWRDFCNVYACAGDA